MKRTLLIIMTVAVLGVLGMYVQKKPGGNTLGASARNSSTTAVSTNPSSSSVQSGNTGSSSAFSDGTFTGSAADTPYGTVQVAVVISGGKITNVNFLRMPSDQGHSREVTAYAEPLLKQNTISAQSADIQFVSGATDTSFGYQESIQKALDQAAQA